MMVLATVGWVYTHPDHSELRSALTELQAVLPRHADPAPDFDTAVQRFQAVLDRTRLHGEDQRLAAVLMTGLRELRFERARYLLYREYQAAGHVVHPADPTVVLGVASSECLATQFRRAPRVTAAAAALASAL